MATSSICSCQTTVCTIITPAAAKYVHVKTYNTIFGQHVFAYRDAKLKDSILECIKK